MTVSLKRADLSSHQVDEPPRSRLKRALNSPACVPIAVSLVGLVLWLIALPSVPAVSRANNVWGLLAAASPLLASSLLVNGIGFSLAVRRAQQLAGWVAVAVSIVQMRLLFTLGTEMPYFSWTYKHLAVVDYIQQHGTVARDVDIYHHWFSLFAATAWFSDITGLSPTALAHWFTPAVYVLEAIAVYAVARCWDLTPMRAIIVVFLAQSLDWVGQSYFSPQFTALLLAFGMLAILGLSRHRPAPIGLSVLLFTAIVVTHQLTPYWIAFLFCFLGLIKRSTPRWLGFVLLAIAIGFLAYNAGSAGSYGLFKLGSNPFDNVNPAKNAKSNIPTIGIESQRTSSSATTFLTGGFWLLAGVTLLYRMVTRKTWIALATLAFGSGVIILGQSYGGEAIFRVYLYSIVGSAIIIAPVVERVPQAKLYFAVPTALVLSVATVVSLQGLVGPWYAWNMNAEEVALSRRMATELPLNSYFTPAAPVWPERTSGSYVDRDRWNPHYDETMVEAAKLIGSNFDTDASYQTFMDLIGSRGTSPTFLIITNQMAFYDYYWGVLPAGALERLRTRMEADTKHWRLWYNSPDIQIFVTNYASGAA